jgi:hypothetical protein
MNSRHEQQSGISPRYFADRDPHHGALCCAHHKSIDRLLKDCGFIAGARELFRGGTVLPPAVISFGSENFGKNAENPDRSNC